MLEKRQQLEDPPVDVMSGPNGKRIYFHKAYGMRFRSEIFWPRVPISSESGFDVDIQMGAVPHELSDPKVCGYKFQAKPSQILLQTISIADFHITDGKKIIARPKSSVQAEAIQTLLWGWVMAALLHQRETFPLHGSVIKSDKEAVIFCGPTGFGKSLLAMALVTRGYQILDDNLAALFFKHNGAYVHHGIPEIKMHEKDVPIERQNQLFRQRLFPESDKFSIDVSRHFFADSLPVTKVFILEKSVGERSIKPLKGSDKIKALESNIFCARFIKGLDKTRPLFQFLMRLAQRVDLFLIREPHGKDFPTLLIDRLEQKLFITL